MGFFFKRSNSLRHKIMASVGAMAALSLAGFGMSLFRLNEVSHRLESINTLFVPLRLLFAQTLADAELLRAEVEQNSGLNALKGKPRKLSHWIQDMVIGELDQVDRLLQKVSDSPWRVWAGSMRSQILNLNQEANLFLSALEAQDFDHASQFYLKWQKGFSEWKRQLEWGSLQFERRLGKEFSETASKVAELQSHLEAALVFVILMIFVLLWMGERALRPLDDLTRLAQEITKRGLRKEDKSLLPELSLSRTDEVFRLSREFHHMATSLLEREKTVESQKARLQDQNRLLREMGELNKTILNSIESILIVTDLEGRISQVNPEAVKWLDQSEDHLMHSSLDQSKKLTPFLSDFKGLSDKEKLLPRKIEGRTYGGSYMPLQQEGESRRGAILILHDLTDEMRLQERLQQAESLAAVGRLSAQVAHEVRNPLHSIGLEAELALEALQSASSPVQHSLVSILKSVDRLQSITENYLRFSRLSAGHKARVNLKEILESVLATYASACEALKVKVDWETMPESLLEVYGDLPLLEQSIGNLFKNSLQALEGQSDRRIWFQLGNTEDERVYLRIADNGAGIDPSVQERLFTPFVTTKASGTGLGLSFIKQVLEDHNGEIRCISERFSSFVNQVNDEVQGACFELILPLLDSRVNSHVMLEADLRVDLQIDSSLIRQETTYV